MKLHTAVRVAFYAGAIVCALVVAALIIGFAI